jgi:hypothetical protein
MPFYVGTRKWSTPYSILHTIILKNLENYRADFSADPF